MPSTEAHNGLSIIPKVERQQVVYVQPPEPPAENVLTISYYGWLLLRSKWKILAAVLFVTALVAVYTFIVTPVYQATVRISIDPRISSAAVGQETDPPGSTDTDQIINTEMQIIQSDAVLRPVAEQYKLLSDNKDSGKKEPKEAETTLSKNGSVSASKVENANTSKNEVASPAKSEGVNPATNESAKEGKSAEDAALTEAPVSLDNLVVSHPPNSLLIDISYRSENKQKAALIANAIAQSYILLGMETRAHTAMNLSSFMEKQIAQLKTNMQASSLALSGYEHKLGVINPNEKTSMVAAHLLQLQSEYTVAQNDRIQKETEYRALRPGSVTPLSGAALEMSPQAGMLGQQEAQVRAAQERLVVTKTIYGINHPEYKRALRDVEEVTRQYEQMRGDISKRIQVAYQEALHRERMLQDSLTEAKRESDELDANYAQYEELKREADADKNLYEELFRKIKEAGVNAGFQGSSIRITNQARPPLRPVFPRRGLLTGLAFILSLFGSIIVVVLADMFDNTLRNPDHARRLVGCDVVGMLPKVKAFPSATELLKPEDQSPRILAQTLGMSNLSRRQVNFESSIFYRESIAILLSTVMHNREGGKPHSLLITSPSPGDGKSNCAAHLAMANANLGRRTLLIDGDLRIPFQHKFFELKNEVGLGGAIASGLSLDAVRQRVEGANASFDVVVAGPASRHTFSQVGPKIAKLLEQARKEYDLIIVDAPPMVGLSDPVQIACATDSVLIIGHASRTSTQAVADVVSTLRRVNANVLGVVLNQVRPTANRSYSLYAGSASYASQLTG